jgi:hypothetical protein
VHCALNSVGKSPESTEGFTSNSQELTYRKGVLLCSSSNAPDTEKYSSTVSSTRPNLSLDLKPESESPTFDLESSDTYLAEGTTTTTTRLRSNTFPANFIRSSTTTQSSACKSTTSVNTSKQTSLVVTGETIQEKVGKGENSLTSKTIASGWRSTLFPITLLEESTKSKSTCVKRSDIVASESKKDSTRSVSCESVHGKGEQLLRKLKLLTTTAVKQDGSIVKKPSEKNLGRKSSVEPETVSQHSRFQA